jgi:large subunit ribosomal protein L17
MRHQKNSRRLGRITSHRKAMFRNMATSLLDKSRIETTEIKAKELRRYVERMITLGKRGDLHARRQALAFLRSKDVVAKVFGEYAERFKDRPGGYTRIMKLGTRAGDKEKGKEKGKEKTAAKAPKKTAEPSAKAEKPAKPAKKAETETEKKPRKSKKEGGAE